MSGSTSSTGATQALVNQANGAYRSATNRTTIAQNFDAFLLLLTTQLKNQSPLDPMDTNQFTQQLVQFASVEQQLRSNDTLNALLTSVRASAVSTAASFVGMEITADGNKARLTNGKAEWMLNAARGGQASITITDSQGNVVAAKTMTVTAGAQKFTWDGKTSTGTDAAAGDYKITVSAKDASGQEISVKTEITGRVDTVDMTEDEPVLVVGSLRVALAHVRSIRRPDSN